MSPRPAYPKTRRKSTAAAEDFLRVYLTSRAELFIIFKFEMYEKYD